jgi:flagellar basal-body rod protein FlgB
MPSVSVMSQLESFLRLTNKRETVVAANMANVDTPGYRTQDFDFKHELDRAMSKVTSDVDIAPTNVAVHNVSGLLERADGNNVDLDRESMLLSETQLQYQMGTQLMKQRFHQLLSAINGGGQ